MIARKGHLKEAEKKIPNGPLRKKNFFEALKNKD